MTSSRIPVTFDFFKKYTYYEECVDALLKLKANGDQEVYERILNNKESQERALKAYYEAFYLRPEIRQKYHIRLKSAPKRIKDKLLSIPIQDTNKVVPKQNEEQNATEFHIKDLTSNKYTDGECQKQNIPSKQFLLASQSVFDADCIADDDEPLCSPEVLQNLHEAQQEKLYVSNSHQGLQQTGTLEEEAKEICDASGVDIFNKREKKMSYGSNADRLEDEGKETTIIHNKSALEKDNSRTKEITDQNANNKNGQSDLINVKRTNATSADEVPSTSTNRNPNFNYKALIPYLHCCPLNFKEFRKYSNIDKLVADFCKTKNMDAHQQRMILHRSHLLFYLAPEHRKLPPIKDIQLLDDCPLAIKEKFFNTPINLYLKEKNYPKETKKQLQTERQLNHNNEDTQILLPAGISNSQTGTQLVGPVDVDEENPKTSPQKALFVAKTVTLDIGEEGKSKTKADCIQVNCTLADTEGASVPAIRNNILSVSNTLAIYNNKEERNNDPIHVVSSNSAQKNKITTPNTGQTKNNVIENNLNATSTSDTIIKFPVSLNEFKKHTYYEEIVEELFKLRSQDNEDLFLKYKSNKTAFDNTLMYYYRAFYLLPAIREIWPVRLKPMPSFKRNLLLQIPEGVIMAPLNMFTARQLIVPDLTISEVNSNKSSSNTEAEHAKKPVEVRPIETETSLAPEGGLKSSPADIMMTAVKVENNTETSDFNNCLKRSINEAVESPSPKRQKIAQSSDKTKKSYKDLLPYARCCPVSFCDFTKYSNVSELFTGYCQKRYNSLKKLSHMLKRAYILFYLAPENRNLKPFNKFKVLAECPLHIKEKMFDIPTSLLKEEENDLLQQEKISTEPQVEPRAEDPEMAKVSKDNNQQNSTQVQKTGSQKPMIEILENRLLPPIKQTLSEQHNKKGSLCPNSCCIFNHITYTDIKNHTNIPSVHPEPLDLTVTQNIFKQLIYKIVNELSCNEKYMIGPALTCKILKHKIICDKCVTDVLNWAPTPATSCSVIESDRTSNTSFETVVERGDWPNKRIQSSTKIRSAEERPLKKIVTDKRCQSKIQSGEDEVTQNSVADKRTNSSTQIATKENPGKTSGTCAEVETIRSPATSKRNCVEIPAKSTEIAAVAVNPKPLDSTIGKSSPTNHTHNVASHDQTIDMWKDKKLFSKFCQKLLAKLQQTFDGTVDFSSEAYKVFVECNEIPLRELLKDICEKNDNNVQSILNNTELYEALQRYYYFKYVRNKDFALKYPVKVLREKSSETRAENEKETDRTSSSILDISHLKPHSVSQSENSALLNSIKIYDEIEKDVSADQEKSISNNNVLEKAKRIFFRNVDKTHTLAYVLRTSFGYKHVILRTILNLTFNEFLELTNIYEGSELYADKHVAECMYRYVCRTPLVWPTNLFITMEKLCNFLHQKNIHFDNYSTMLFYISPKVLHWSNLLTCTNILDCVRSDYEKRTGKWLDTDNIPLLKQECVEYYNRCWKHEKWLAHTPLLDEEFCIKFSNVDNTVKDDAAMTDQPTTGVCCTDVAEVPGDDTKESTLHPPNCVSDIIVLSPSEMNRPASVEEYCNELNCVLLPNTQEQIEMLPAEQTVSTDPLNSSGTSQLNLNVSQLSQETYEVETLGELIQPIKTEPAETKLLSNLIFFEDENNDMQCVVCEEEIVELDTTLQSQVAADNLPSSQVDFDVLLSGEDLQTLLVQHFPSAADSNVANTQQPSLQSTGQLIQMQDVSLLSSGEIAASPESGQAINLQDCQGLEPAISEVMQSFSDGSGLSGKNYNILQEGQRLPSTFEETQTSSGNSVKTQQQELDKSPPKTVKDTIDSMFAVRGKPQETKITDKQIEPTVSKSSCKSSYQTNTGKTGLPKRAGILNTKNIATVKPLPNSGLVPQIQHNTRPLQTVPAFSANSSTTKPAQSTESQIVAPASLMLNLTPTSNSQGSTGSSSQNSSFQLQLPQFGTHIFISQELNKNCSVFDNSSLLRIVDHNYHLGNATNLVPANSEHLPLVENAQQQTDPEVTNLSNTMCPDNNTLPNEQQPVDKTNVRPARRVTRKSSKCLPNSSQPNTGSNLLKICNASDNLQQQACSRIVTRRISSLGKDTNEKVNNLTITKTSNLVTSLTITVNQQHLPHPIHPPIQRAPELARKVFLYRCISKFHYFKELTPQHMSKYLLPSQQVGKSYSEAVVVCENFKTRISNRSISALFPFWSKAVQRDFLLVVDDLKEFHYNVFERKSMQKQEDLRGRILFWLLHTAPLFSLCQFSYEKNNSEFSHCEAIQSRNNPSYERKPFQCLTNALGGKTLKKLAEMKRIVDEK